jgi:hypothetical protein
MHTNKNTLSLFIFFQKSRAKGTKQRMMAIKDIYGFSMVYKPGFKDKYFYISDKMGCFIIGRNTWFYSQITAAPIADLSGQIR